MYHGVNAGLGDIEMITAYSYLGIALGFGLRWYLARQDGQRAELLWPFMLISIFALCGVTRLIGFMGIHAPMQLMFVVHLGLALIALAYCTGQLLHILFPGEIFRDDTTIPRLTEE
jgi:hypothetical protein